MLLKLVRHQLMCREPRQGPEYTAQAVTLVLPVTFHNASADLAEMQPIQGGNLCQYLFPLTDVQSKQLKDLGDLCDHEKGPRSRVSFCSSSPGVVFFPLPFDLTRLKITGVHVLEARSHDKLWEK